MSGTTSHVGERATYREYAAWPDDGKRYEILDGVVSAMSAPTRPHQEVAAQLWRELDRQFSTSNAGRAWIAPLDVVFGEDTVLQPDVIAVRSERLEIARTEAVFGAPDFVAEILSPSTSPRDSLDKRLVYERHGVREYWILDPSARVLWQLALANGVLSEVDRFENDAEVESRAFPGLRVNLASVWPRS